MHNVEVYSYRLHEQFLQQLIYPTLLLMVHLKQSFPICGNFFDSCCEFQWVMTCLKTSNALYISYVNMVYYSTKVLKRIENCGEKNQQKSWIRNQSGSTIDNICSTFRKKVVRKRLYWQTVLKLRFCGLGWVTVIRSHCRSVTEGVPYMIGSLIDKL